ncbi:MAG: hypothetical protein JNM39_10385 [Bdellovibrionaceae bacterium]|nr:hypothetical protein [Pseudobdellovibrionaceae bacterium]
MMETTIKEMRTICLIFGLVAISIWAKAGSFYELSPPKDRIEGIEFPRNWSVLYRGTTEGQLSLPDAISALFGQEEVNLESMFFSTIKKELMGESVSQGVELTSSLRQSIKKMIRQNQGFFNLKEASKITINLVDEVFENMLNDKKSLTSNRPISDEPHFEHPENVDQVHGL